MAYTNAIYYIDLVNGNDAARTALTGVIASNPSGTITRCTYVNHGLTTGAIVVLSAFTTWLNAAWKITKVDNDTFDLDGAVWSTTADANGTVTPNGGGSWADAWKTVNLGATAARIAGGDTMRISKTPDPVSIGNALWTSREGVPQSSPYPAAIAITSSTNASPIEITKAGHGYVTDDIIQVIGHTSNASANGAWKITKVDDNKFNLNGSVGIGVGGANGTIQKINSKAVVLATSDLTKNIDRCNVNWIGANDCTPSLLTSDHKEGGTCIKLQMDATPQANLIQAYRAVGTLDLSGYQQISFWLRPNAAIANSTTYTINLCSNADGTGVVDTFIVPAIPMATYWQPVVLTKSGGGNLGNSIQSIAIYTGATAPSASHSMNIDNIIACTTNGLNMVSLISKNGLAQGGDEGYYAIQSINNTIVLIDGVTSSMSNVGRGYFGVTETATTYIRETLFLGYVTEYAGVVVPNKTGNSFVQTIGYEFGFEVGTENQNGETFLDGRHSFGYGFYCPAHQYNSLNFVNFFRFRDGLSITARIIIKRISNASHNSNNGFNFNNHHLSQIDQISNANCNGSVGINLNNCNNFVFNRICNANNTVTGNYGIGVVGFGNTFHRIENASNIGGYGFGTITSADNKINYIKAEFNSYNGIISAGGDYFANVYTANNVSGGVGTSQFPVFLRNTYISEAVMPYPSANSRCIIWIYKDDGVEGNNWGYASGAIINWQTTVKHNSEAGAWKIAYGGSNVRDVYNPFEMTVAEIACSANKLVTITAWVKKDHATDIAAYLKVYEDIANGISATVITSKANDTDWELLSFTFTPVYESVVVLYFGGYYVSGGSNIYIGTITVSQAV